MWRELCLAGRWHGMWEGSARGWADGGGQASQVMAGGPAWRLGGRQLGLRGSGQTQVLLCGGALLLFQGPCIVLNCPSGFVGKEPACNVGDTRDSFDPWVGKIPWRRAGQRTPVFLPGESCGQRSLAGWSP